MNLRLSPLANTHTAHIIAAAVSASVLTYAVLELRHRASVKRRRKELGNHATKAVYGNVGPSGSNISEDTFGEQAVDLTEGSSEILEARGNLGLLPYDESLIREQLSRNYSFFGEEGMRRVRNGRVAIVGCGGVGSWATIMLVRSGVSYIRLIDFDMVTLSSLNRHAVAVLSDVGTSKVGAMKKFLSKIAPWVEVDARMELWRAGEEGEELIGGNIDWVIDAIDNINTKVELLRVCHSKGIKVFASMGAGAKCDPTRVQISDISNTYEDPLARSVRRRLRLEGITTGIPVVYSTEVAGDVKLLPLPEEEFQRGSVHELGPFNDFRVRILPVLGPLPSIFGLHIATYILCDLAGKPILNPLATRNRRKVYEKLLRDLGAREAKSNEGGFQERLSIDESDVAYIFEDLNRGRSSIPPHPILAKPLLARWDHSKPLAIENCVVLSPEDLKLLEAAGGRGDDVEVWSDGTSRNEVLGVVKDRMKEAGQWLKALG